MPDPYYKQSVDKTADVAPNAQESPVSAKEAGESFEPDYRPDLTQFLKK